MIKLDSIKETIMPNFRGGQGDFCVAMFKDDLNKIMKGRLEPGCSIGMHCHETSSEIIFILSGNGRTVCDGVEEAVTAGDCLYCKKSSSHTLINDSTAPLVFYAVVAEQ